jgi:hypothetical protein
MLTSAMAMLFGGFGSGFGDAARARTRAVPVLLALTVMLKLDEAPLAREPSVQV